MLKDRIQSTHGKKHNHDPSGICSQEAEDGLTYENSQYNLTTKLTRMKKKKLLDNYN